LVEGDQATIGITEFAQGELGDIVFVDIATQGETLGAEEVFGSVEAVKTVSELYMPVAGEVLEVNSSLDGTPESINADPYGDGWMIKVKMSNAADADALLTADQYKALIGA
jgi:glycine cleavage system H protein